jgi:hypothetical protein
MSLTSILVIADLSTASVEPLTSSIAGDDGSFEGDYWDNTTQTTTGPAPVDPGSVTSTAAPSSSSTGPTLCSGNQVEASGCIPAAIASATAYSGVQPPACDKADGDAGTLPRVNATIAAQAAADYCAALISSGVVLTATDSDTKPYTEAGVAENNSAMTLTVIFAVQACPTDQSMKQVDFKSLGQAECYSNMYTSISEVCAQDKTWSDYNPNFTLEGGVFENDCAMWSISAE